jgi:hypothetical protein
VRRSPAPVPLLAAILATALLLAGCSGGGSDAASEAGTSASSGGGGGESAGGDGGAADAAAPGGAGGGPDTITSVAAARVAPGKALILTGGLELRVEDVSRAADEAGRTAVAAGGSVEAEERSSGGDDGSAVVVLRVPPRAFDQTMTRLADLGEELSRQRGTEDVSEEVVDLDTRIATQRASVARVRALLDRANTIGEIVQVEAELTRRTADLESLEARLAVLAEQVEHSTITVRLQGEDGPGALASGPLGFGDGLRAGWGALVAFGRAVGVTAGALLPFAPLLVAGALLWRARSRRATGGPVSPGTAGA